MYLLKKNLAVSSLLKYKSVTVETESLGGNCAMHNQIGVDCFTFHSFSHLSASHFLFPVAKKVFFKTMIISKQDMI